MDIVIAPGRLLETLIDLAFATVTVLSMLGTISVREKATHTHAFATRRNHSSRLCSTR
jgi:predicted DNA-binding protein with PD1-like motif